MVSLKIKDQISQALVHTRASQSFIHAHIVKKLKFNPQGGATEVALASTSNSANINGFIEVNASVLGNDYLPKLGVIDKLCADVILGQDFLKIHESVTTKMGGTQPSITIRSKEREKTTYKVSVAKVTPPRLFQFLDNKIKPIATKSRKFNSEDKKKLKMF